MTMLGIEMMMAGGARSPAFRNLAALFGGGAVDGIMIDLTDKTTLFQDANGAAAVINNGDPVGLALDQHKWGGLTLAAYRAAQTEKITNGEFSANISGWTIANGTGAWSAGRMQLTANSGSTPKSEQLVSGLTIGRWYELSLNSLGRQSGTGTQVGFSVGTSTGTADNLVYQEIGISAGTHRRFFKATATSLYVRFFGAAVSGSVTLFESFSLKEIDGHHAYQASVPAKPLWSSATNDVFFASGSTQFLTTDFVLQSNDNFLAAYHGSLGSIANRVVLGAFGSTGLDAAIGMSSSSGYERMQIGNVGNKIGNIVISNTTGTLLADKNTANAHMFVNGVLNITTPTPGSYPTTTALYVGAVNNNGSPTQHVNGNLKRIVAGRVRVQDTMTAADFHQNLIAA